MCTITCIPQLTANLQDIGIDRLRDRISEGECGRGALGDLLPPGVAKMILEKRSPCNLVCEILDAKADVFEGRLARVAEYALSVVS